MCLAKSPQEAKNKEKYLLHFDREEEVKKIRHFQYIWFEQIRDLPWEEERSLHEHLDVSWSAQGGKKNQVYSRRAYQRKQIEKTQTIKRKEEREGEKIQWRSRVSKDKDSQWWWIWLNVIYALQSSKRILVICLHLVYHFFLDHRPKWNSLIFIQETVI